MYERVMSLWKQGKTSKEIEAILGLAEADVLGYVRKGSWYKPRCKKIPQTAKCALGNLKIANNGQQTNFTHKKFVELWNMHIPISKMAEILGTTSGNVRVYASRHRDECPSRNKSRKK